jgi:hypothetical protein
MRRRGDHGRRLTRADKLEIQRRVRSGEELGAAALAVGCSRKSVQRLPNATGGLAPRSTARSALRLSLAEREEISRGLLAGESSQPSINYSARLSSCSRTRSTFMMCAHAIRFPAVFIDDRVMALRPAKSN